MKDQIKYEWTLEVIEDGDIVDSDFSDTLSFAASALVGNDLGLVRNSGNENDGVNTRYWAYAKDDKLPEYFADANGVSVGYKVPERFHIELSKYLGK